jgi:ParB-like chromosome segregation protein Spo0J
VQNRPTQRVVPIGALTANFHRPPHTPFEEAHAFARLLEAGLTRKGIAQRLQVSRELVRDRLEILEVAVDLYARVNDGTIPLGAIRTLAGLAKLHRELPACALRRVTDEPAESWRRRVTWADVIADPIAAVTKHYGDEQPDLPAGVYEAHAEYPLSAFTLSERAEKDLAALARLNDAYADRDAVTTRFERHAVEQAAQLGAAHVSEHEHSALIVGEDVAAELVAAQIAARLKGERARARAERDRLAAAGDEATQASTDEAQNVPATGRRTRRGPRARTAGRAPHPSHPRAPRGRAGRELTVRAVEALRNSDGWQTWLRVRARTGLRLQCPQPAGGHPKMTSVRGTAG